MNDNKALRGLEMEQFSFNFTFKHHTHKKYNVRRMILNALLKASESRLKSPKIKLSAAQFKKSQLSLNFSCLTENPSKNKEIGISLVPFPTTKVLNRPFYPSLRSLCHLFPRTELF